MRVTAADLPDEIRGGGKAGTRPAEARPRPRRGSGTSLHASTASPVPQGRLQAAAGRRGQAGMGKHAAGARPGSRHLRTDSTKRGRRAPREPRKEGTPGWTRKRRRGGQGPHAPDPLLRGRGTDVKPRPRVATQAGTSKPPPRHSPWRAASKPFPEGQSPKHDPKQTRWTHRAPGVTPAPLAAEAGGARGRDP